MSWGNTNYVVSSCKAHEMCIVSTLVFIKLTNNFFILHVCIEHYCYDIVVYVALGLKSVVVLYVVVAYCQ